MAELFIVKATRQVLVGIVDVEAGTATGSLLNGESIVVENAVFTLESLVKVADCVMPTIKAEDGTDVNVLPLNPMAVNSTVIDEALVNTFISAPGLGENKKVAAIDVNIIATLNPTLFA